MANQVDRSVALQAADDLIHRLCPSARKKLATSKSEFRTCDQVIFIPLFITGEAGGQPRLTMQRTTQAISRDNLSLIPAGCYRIHVFDTWLEADAASRVIEGLGFLGWTERSRLAGGQGVLLLRSGDRSKGLEGRILEDTPLSFTTPFASIDIIDERQEFDDDHPCSHMSLDIVSSASYPMFDVLRAIHDFTAGEVSATLRARILANLIRHETLDGVSLRELQRNLEELPGASVALEAVCVEDVVVEIEEISDGLEHQVSAPSDEILHAMILEGLQDAQSAEELARHIACQTFIQNLTHPC